MSKIDKIICNKIKTIREKSGYTQQNIADFLGMDLVKVKLMEQGLEFPSATKIYYLCFILDCNPNEIFPPIRKGNKQDMKAAVKELMKKLCA